MLAVAVLLTRPAQKRLGANMPSRTRRRVRFFTRLNLIFGALTVVLAVLYSAGVPWAAINRSPAFMFTLTFALACQLACR